METYRCWCPGHWPWVDQVDAATPEEAVREFAGKWVASDGIVCMLGPWEGTRRFRVHVARDMSGVARVDVRPDRCCHCKVTPAQGHDWAQDCRSCAGCAFSDSFTPFIPGY